MSSFRVRPRFKHLVQLEAKEAEEVIMSNVMGTEYVFAEGFLQGHADIKIPVAERHFWSPQLHLSTEQTEKGTIIRGLYGPNPTVWGLFFFGYLTLGVLSFFAGFWGLTKLTLGHSAQILWALPAMGALALLLYLIAQDGTKDRC